MILALAGAGAARADLWGYVDETGRSHLASEQLDGRYKLFFKGAKRVAPPAVDPAREAERRAQEAFRNTALFQKTTSQPNASRFEPLIQQFAKLHKVDPALVKAVIAVESAFQPGAVSAKGALGLMQIIPETGERYGIVGDRRHTAEQKLLDPATNVRVGTLHLANLLGQFAADIELALAAYNAGENAVQRYENTIPPYPETREYVRLVKQFYSIFRPPATAPQAVDPPLVIPGQRNVPGTTRKLALESAASG